MAGKKVDAATAKARAEKKVANFKSRGNARGKKVLDAIEKVGNLANRKTHSWESAQVEKLFNAITSAVSAARAKFTAKEAVATAVDLL